MRRGGYLVSRFIEDDMTSTAEVGEEATGEIILISIKFWMLALTWFLQPNSSQQSHPSASQHFWWCHGKRLPWALMTVALRAPFQWALGPLQQPMLLRKVARPTSPSMCGEKRGRTQCLGRGDWGGSLSGWRRGLRDWGGAGVELTAQTEMSRSEWAKSQSPAMKTQRSTTNVHLLPVREESMTACP